MRLLIKYVIVYYIIYIYIYLFICQHEYTTPFNLARHILSLHVAKDVSVDDIAPGVPGASEGSRAHGAVSTSIYLNMNKQMSIGASWRSPSL